MPTQIHFSILVPHGLTHEKSLISSVGDLNNLDVFFKRSYLTRMKLLEYEQVYNSGTRFHLRRIRDYLIQVCDVFENLTRTLKFGVETMANIDRSLESISQSRGLMFQNNILSSEYYWFYRYCQKLNFFIETNDYTSIIQSE